MLYLCKKERVMFPRTIVGGISMPRLICGTNWFRGFSHTSAAKDNWIKQLMTPQAIAEVLEVFLSSGCDAIMGGDFNDTMLQAIKLAEDKIGKPFIRILTPHFNIKPGGKQELEPEFVFDRCKEVMGATFVMPHQQVTDALADRRDGIIRDIDIYTKMIRERGMIPGLSTHMPEVPVMADHQNADVETYLQIYNADGFLMQVEVDWVMRIISQAKKPVLTIKPLAAGKLLPPVGLAFVWNTIRDQDMVAIGTMTPDEAKESIELSLTYIERRLPTHTLQETRSKSSLKQPKK